MYELIWWLYDGDEPRHASFSSVSALLTFEEGLFEVFPRATTARVIPINI